MCWPPSSPERLFVCALTRSTSDQEDESCKLMLVLRLLPHPSAHKAVTVDAPQLRIGCMSGVSGRGEYLDVIRGCAIYSIQ